MESKIFLIFKNIPQIPKKDKINPMSIKDAKSKIRIDVKLSIPYDIVFTKTMPITRFLKFEDINQIRSTHKIIAKSITAHIQPKIHITKRNILFYKIYKTICT